MYSGTKLITRCLLFGAGVVEISRRNIIYPDRLKNIVCIGMLATLFFSAEPCLCSPGNATTSHEIAEWQAYSDDDVNLHFLYPKDWEVKERDFYETAGESVARKPTLILGPIQSKSDRMNTIWINMRQATCMTDEVIEEYQNMKLWGIMPRNDMEGCIEAESDGYHLLSFFNNPDIVKVFKRVLGSLQAENEK